MAMRRTRPRRALWALAAVALLAPVAPAGAAPGETHRASLGRNGAEPNGATPATSVADTTSPQLSLDGLKVAFSSDASNLVAGDSNRAADVFVYDMTTRRTERISVASNGSQANGPSHSPAISVDGRYVAFVSAASNLVSGDRNSVEDVFLRDRVARRTTLVSVTSSGRRGNGPSTNPRISLFGRFVVFDSQARFNAGDTNDMPDVFVRDTERRLLWRMNPPPEPPRRTVGDTEVPDPSSDFRTTWTQTGSISYDGRYVAFARGTYERAPGVPSSMDVFVLDRQRGRYTKVEMAPWMSAARVLTDNPVISADGRYVAFEAWSILDNAVGSDEALVRNPLDPKDIYIYDRVTRSTGLVSVNSFFQHGNADSSAPSISAGGHYVAFRSDATNLVAGDTNGSPDVFVRDNVARTTSRMSVSAGHAQAVAGGTRPSISYEGRRVAFASTSSNLVSGDRNGRSDVFWRDRRTDTTNHPPDLRSIPVRTISPLEETEVRLRASDRDRDPLRFGLLLVTPPRSTTVVGPDGFPPGASLNPSTGIFRWTPNPDQAGSWRFIFWVNDPRGAADFQVWDVVVRTADQMARCRADGSC